MERPVLLALGVDGSKALDDGTGIELLLRGEDGEFILALPIREAGLMLVALQDAISDAHRSDAATHRFLIAETATRAPSPIEGQDLLTLTIEGGMKLMFLLPAGSGK